MICRIIRTEFKALDVVSVPPDDQNISS